MGRSPCCDKVGLKKGPWTPEEDQKLLAYIDEHGHGSWRALPARAGLQRCGKSCRLRWTNYLRPDIKRGKFSLQEEQTIIQLHALLGNRWSGIATHLLKRTDNEIKNYWNTHLKKRLIKMGIDPVTHKPKHDVVFTADGQSKNAANLSHMAQWESARLEAEARLVKESKLRSRPIPDFSPSSSSSARLPTKALPPFPPPTSINVLKNWSSNNNIDLESPTSTVTFSETAPRIISTGGMFEFVGSSNSSETAGVIKEEDDEQEWKNIKNSISFTSNFHEISMSIETSWNHELRPNNMDEGFTNLLLNDSDELSLSDGAGDSDIGHRSNGDSKYYEDNKNYWNSILNLVNSSPSDDSPMF